MHKQQLESNGLDKQFSSLYDELGTIGYHEAYLA